MDGGEIALRALGHPRRAANQPVSVDGAGERDDDPLPRLPRSFDPVQLPVLGERLFHAVGHPEQRQLPQGAEVAFAEVVAERRVDALGGVHVPVRHASPQCLR